METEKINEAICKHIRSWISETDRAVIVAGYGSDVMSSIEQICSFAANDPVWSELDYLKSFNDCMNHLKVEYPFLTEESVRRSANVAAYFWK